MNSPTTEPHTQPSPPATRPARRRRLLPTALGLLILAAALGYGGWSWHEYERPGRVHERRGVEDAAAGRFHEAERQWRQGVREDPTFPGCYEHLGDLYQQVRDYPDAAADFQAAARLNPRDGTLFQRLAIAELAQEDERDAFPAAKRAYELLPDSADAAGTYGLLAARAADGPAAIAALQRAHRLAPTVRPYWAKLLSVEADTQQWPTLERDAAAYLRAYPGDPWASYLMAVAYHHEPHTPANLRAAIGYAEQSVSRANAPMQAYPLLGQLYLDAGRRQDALRACRTALRLAPDNQEVLYELIGCFSRLDQPQMAARVSALLKPLARRRDRIVYLQQVMRQNPTDVASGLELAGLEEQDGNLQMARQYYTALARIAPHDPRPRAALAAFLRRMGRGDLVERLVQQAPPTAAPSGAGPVSP